MSFIRLRRPELQVYQWISSKSCRRASYPGNSSVPVVDNVSWIMEVSPGMKVTVEDMLLYASVESVRDELQYVYPALWKFGIYFLSVT